MQTLDLLRELRNEAIHGGDLSGLEEEGIIELKNLHTALAQRWGIGNAVKLAVKLAGFPNAFGRNSVVL
jgi:hypothetical protein